MFGRSGQMFPRRTFHDAIYEEEYGSDNEDECCKCRGLSAILCWFLSVIILVGLAATVVLTVFFILRSRTMLVKPDVDLDVEMYGKDQNLFEPGGATSKELIGSSETGGNGVEGSAKRKKGGGKSSTKNDVEADVNEEENAIIDSDEDTSASVRHNQQTNRLDKLQPYSITSTTTEPTTAEEGDEEQESSEETEPNDGEGSSLFNLFSGPRNPSYNTPHHHNHHHDHNTRSHEFTSKEIRHEEDGPTVVISAESSETRYNDGSPVQQVLFTESPKVTATTPNPHNNRRNLQSTRFPTGRTSFSSSTTTAIPTTAEESGEDVGGHVNEEESEDDGPGVVIHHEEEDEEEEEEERNHEKSSEENNNNNDEDEEKAAPETTTSVYDTNSGERENEMGSQSGESQLKQMLLDEIPPHDGDKDEEEASSEFNLTQKGTTTKRPSQGTKPTKNRQDTLTRIISRNFTRQSTTEMSTDTTEYSTDIPQVTTFGPGGHKYDYTMTPWERTKVKSTESAEADESVEVAVTKPPPKFRYRSTTPRTGSGVVATPEPTTASPRTRGTTASPNSAEFGMKLGAGRGSVESPIDIVPSPDLSPKGQLAQELEENSAEGVDLTSGSNENEDASKNSEQFLDVLVGAEQGGKTLVTKKTDDGIVTSAILPPWYDGANSSNINDVLKINGTVSSNVVAKAVASAEKFGKKTRTKLRTVGSSEERIFSATQQPETSKEEHNRSDFDRLVDILSKQETSSEEQPAASSPTRFGYKKPKPVVLKKPGRYIPLVPGRANLFPNKPPVPSSSTSVESSKQASGSMENRSAVPSASSPEEVVQVQADATANIEVQPSAEPGDIGRTGVPSEVVDAVDNGYYPDDNTDQEKAVEHQVIESGKWSSDEIGSMEEAPSHVIDVSMEEPGNPTEIIIEQDASAQTEDEEGGYAEDDYGYGEDPPTMAMAGSQPNNQVVPPPADYVRGSGIRKPVSSEEHGAADLEAGESVQSAESVTTTPMPPQELDERTTASPPVAIRRPAYTREEILKSVVRPSQEVVAAVETNSVGPTPGSGEGGSGSEEYEEYEDDNYDGGSVEQDAGPSQAPAAHWSSEKLKGGVGVEQQKWSEPELSGPSAAASPPNFGSQEIHESAEHIPLPTVQQSINSLENTPPQAINTESNENASGIFTPPKLVSFHENKLSFSPPVQAEEEYHSKDGWRPVLSGSSPNGQATAPDFNGAATSQERNSAQQGSFEQAEADPQQYQEAALPAPPQPQQQPIAPPQQQWAQEPPQDLSNVNNGKIKPSPLIPPPMPATVKFPDSEEDHEDRHHHGRHKLRHPHQHPMNNFDRAKYMVRPVPPPIVMRRHPHSTGPYPPHGPPHNRQNPPPPPPRQQMMPQASQQNPQFEPRPQVAPLINRNFHIRPNPMRRFNFAGGPPQAQPRSGANIKWPSEEDDKRASSQTETSTNSKRRRRRRAVG